MPLDLNYPVWNAVAPFLDPSDRFALLALCRASVISQVRQDFFAQSTWRIPSTQATAERVFRTLTMKPSIREVHVDRFWQLAFLSALPALESVHIAGHENTTEALSLVPIGVKKLHLSDFHHADLAALRRLSNLEDLALKGESLQNVELLAELPKLTHLSVEILRGPTFQLTGRLPALQALKVKASTVDTTSLGELPLLKELVLQSCEVGSLAPLMSLAPQLKVFDIQNTQSTASPEEKEALASALTNVERLNLCGACFLDNLSPLASLTSLRVLHLNECFFDLQPLAELTELEELSIDGSLTIDWSALTNLKKLRRVNQGANLQNWNVGSITVLRSLPLLTSLKGPITLSSSFSLTHLTELEIRGGIQPVELEPGCCPAVERLKFEGAVKVNNFEQCFPRLRWLECGCGGFAHRGDLRELSHLTRLERLHISCGCDNHDGFAFLSALTSLRELSLQEVSISDLSVLGTMKMLRSLRLANAPVIDVAAIAGLTELRELDVGQTDVRDVACLRGHPNLRRLMLPNGANWETLVTGEEDVDLPNCIEIRLDGGSSLVWPTSTQ